MLGRDAELLAVRAGLNAISNGTRAVLVLRGEAGVGKTSLLDQVVDLAPPDIRVLRTTGVEAEADLGYAAVERLLRPVLHLADRLPAPQRVALTTAFGMTIGDRPDRFYVGLAVLSLLTGATADGPVVCIIDDAQWLDQESVAALTFVARRLLADGVAMYFAVRDDVDGSAFADLPTLAVAGLAADAAHELLQATATNQIDPGVADRIVADTGGNPLAIVELARATNTEIERIVVHPEPLPLARRLEGHFGRRVAELPSETQLGLAVVAADTQLEAWRLERTAAALGIELDALEPAERAGLVTRVDGVVTFRHPLVRSASYSSVPATTRRRIHAALAATLDQPSNLERRAWHAAAATAGPDAEVVQLLLLAADRAGRRGALRAQTELLVRAAELSDDDDQRAAYYIEANVCTRLYSDHARGDVILARASAAARDPAVVARIEHELAISDVWRRRFGSVPARMLVSVGVLDRYDRLTARAFALQTIVVYRLAGRLAVDVDAHRVATAILALPRDPAWPPTAQGLLLDGWANVVLGGWTEAGGALVAGLDAWKAATLSPNDVFVQILLPVTVACERWDYPAQRAVIEQSLAIARGAHAVTLLASCLTHQAHLDTLEGNLEEAADAMAEWHETMSVIADNPRWTTFADVVLVATTGKIADAEAALDGIRASAQVEQCGLALDLADLAEAILGNATGQYDRAAGAAARVVADPISGFTAQCLAELVEASCRRGDVATAAAAAAQIRDRLAVAANPIAVGIGHRTDAQLDDDHADASYRAAIEALTPTTARLDLARSHLLYGEWLRRHRRRLDARNQLRIAYDVFTTIGAAAFAERAWTELEASGEHARRRRAGPDAELTPRERQIAALARSGATNQEIGERLYISANTVDYHLRSIFRKLNISSRRQLPV